jgi:hypothetical protein
LRVCSVIVPIVRAFLTTISTWAIEHFSTRGAGRPTRDSKTMYRKQPATAGYSTDQDKYNDLLVSLMDSNRRYCCRRDAFHQGFRVFTIEQKRDALARANQIIQRSHEALLLGRTRRSLPCRYMQWYTSILTCFSCLILGVYQSDEEFMRTIADIDALLSMPGLLNVVERQAFMIQIE